MKRICTECGEEMLDGYVIYDGGYYYCSEECLHKNMTQEEYLKLYNSDDAYWTMWWDEEDEEEGEQDAKSCEDSN